MREQLYILIFLLYSFPRIAFSQDTEEVDSTIGRLQNLFYSDSSTFHFSLSEIDTQLIKRIGILNDTLPYFPYTTIDKPYTRDRKIKSKYKEYKKPAPPNFMADSHENWRSGDHITSENEKLPSRRFLLGVTNENWTIIYYWHGGVGKHLHVVLSDKIHLSSFVTLNNSDVFQKLDLEKRLKEVKSLQLKDLVNTRSVKYLNNKLLDDGGDIF